MLRLSDSNQLKPRAPQRPNQPSGSSNAYSTSIPSSAPPLLNSFTASTGLSSLAEPTLQQRHSTKARDANKLTSESSSLNFKSSSSYAHLIRSQSRKLKYFKKIRETSIILLL